MVGCNVTHADGRLLKQISSCFYHGVWTGFLNGLWIHKSSWFPHASTVGVTGAKEEVTIQTILEESLSLFLSTSAIRMFVLLRFVQTPLLPLISLVQICGKVIYELFIFGKHVVERELDRFEKGTHAYSHPNSRLDHRRSVWIKPCGSFTTEFMVMPSRELYQLLDRGEASHCLFIGSKTADAFHSISHFPSPIIIIPAHIRTLMSKCSTFKFI